MFKVGCVLAVAGSHRPTVALHKYLAFAQRYHWYKIIFKETNQLISGGNDPILMLGGIGLFSEGNSNPYTDLVWNTAADGKPATLKPGEVCLSRTGYSTQSGREPINFFKIALAQVNYGKTLVAVQRLVLHVLPVIPLESGKEKISLRISIVKERA